MGIWWRHASQTCIQLEAATGNMRTTTRRGAAEGPTPHAGPRKATGSRGCIPHCSHAPHRQGFTLEQQGFTREQGFTPEQGFIPEQCPGSGSFEVMDVVRCLHLGHELLGHLRGGREGESERAEGEGGGHVRGGGD